MPVKNLKVVVMVVVRVVVIIVIVVVICCVSTDWLSQCHKYDAMGEVNSRCFE